MSRFFFSLGLRRLARLLQCYLFRIGPGVRVDQEPGAGVGVGTAPPRLRTTAENTPSAIATTQRRRLLNPIKMAAA